jgi:aspartyl-tRNA(Asn)/glutamyl-tRNA(Gln) amidotransferase subunit C
MKSSDILTKEKVRHIASLAHVILSDDEVIIFTDQLNSILSYFEILNKAESKTLSNPSNDSFQTIRFQDDLEHDQTLSTKKSTANANTTDKGYILTNQVVKK